MGKSQHIGPANNPKTKSVRSYKKMYNTQVQGPSKGDFCELVKKHIETLDMKLTSSEIENLSKTKLKN